MPRSQTQLDDAPSPRRRRRHGRGSWLTDKPHQIPRVTSGQAPPHQGGSPAEEGGLGGPGGGRWRGAWESGSSPSRRRPASFSVASVVEPLGWDKKGNWPHLDCCMITLGSRWKVPIVPELGTEKSSRTSVKLRTTMAVSSWTSTQNRGSLGDGRPQTRANRESRLHLDSSRVNPRGDRNEGERPCDGYGHLTDALSARPENHPPNKILLKITLTCRRPTDRPTAPLSPCIPPKTFLYAVWFFSPSPPCTKSKQRRQPDRKQHPHKPPFVAPPSHIINKRGAHRRGKGGGGPTRGIL